MNNTIVLGSRGSDLALWQAHHIVAELREKRGCQVSIEIIKTSGDKIDTLPFDKMEGKGFFTKELEEALLGRKIDLAVHSLKDLMTSQPDGLTVAAVGYRADRRELLLVRPESYLAGSALPVREGGVIGTSSARRQCQVADLKPGLQVTDLRGNVPTRIGQLRDGQYDAILIAKAGVDRLNLDLGDLRQVVLDPEIFLPAPAQGILGLQIRSDDERVARLVSPLNFPEDQLEVSLERGLLAKFDAGCSLPLGVYSQLDGENLRLQAVLGEQGESGWTGLRRIDLRGTDARELVNRVFVQLTERRGACA